MINRHLNRILGLVIALMILLNFSFYSFATTGGLPLFWFLKTALSIGLLILLLKGIQHLASGAKKGKWSLTIYMTLLFLLPMELFFTFIARSHHAEISYGSLIWQYRHYHLNEDGFRDEPIGKKDHDLPALVFCGDSFTAGLGTNRRSQRFSDKVHSVLKDQYEFYNIGLKATGLREQHPQLAKIPNEEKILIYQAYVNDFDDFCDRRLETHSFDIYQNFTSWDKYWAKSMFLLNYLYFSFHNDGLIHEYYDFYNGCSNNPEVFLKYEQKLKEMLTDAHEELGYRQIIVVYVPTLADLNFGLDFKQQLEQTLKAFPYVTFADIDDEVSRLPIRARIVNWQDTHASNKVQQIIALKVLSLLEF